MLNNIYLTRMAYILFSKVLSISNNYYINKNNLSETSPSAEISFTANEVLIKRVDASDMLMSFSSFDYDSSGSEIKKEVFPYVFFESILFMLIKSLFLFFIVSYFFSSEISSYYNLTEDAKQCVVAGITFAFSFRFFITSLAEIRKRMYVIAFFSSLLNNAKMNTLLRLKINIIESSKVSIFMA